MRQIGTISDRSLAERFTAFLITQEIDAQGELEENDWVIWVRDEDRLDFAREALKQFMANPNDAQFVGAEQTAESILLEKARKRAQTRKNVVQMRGQWRQPGKRRAPLVISIIVMTIVVGLLTQMGDNPKSVAMRSLSFCDTMQRPGWNNDRINDRLVDIKSGQIWRIVTPIFLHFGIWHLLFNMAWLWVFGSQIEDRRGSMRLVLMILAIAVASNLAQGLVPPRYGGGAGFGGMSGVVYGLLGYLWIKTRYEPTSGMGVGRGTFLFLMVWMFIGFSGLLSQGGIHIANWAHGVGLLAGLAIGYWPVWRKSA